MPRHDIYDAQGNVTVIDPRTLEEAKAERLELLAERRWRAETGGTTFAALPVATDDRSQAKIMGARLAANADPGYVVKWKTAAGFVDLNAPAIVALSDAVRAHVQSCFDREAELTADIEAAATREAVDAIDIETGWPG